MTTINQTADYINKFRSHVTGFELISTSITDQLDSFLALAKNGDGKKLVFGVEDVDNYPDGFKGDCISNIDSKFLMCDLNHVNASALRKLYPFTKPVTLGKASSFGFGDRLGNAGTAHIRSLIDSKPFFLPVFAQQSIRELDRTGRSAEEVMDAASWSVFQMGYTNGFGADADHLKTTDDIDQMIRAGFTMFTIDPSDYVNNHSQNMNESQLYRAFYELPWDELEDDPDKFLKRYAGKTLKLVDNESFKPTTTDILRAAVKYGKVIVHTRDMYRYLHDTYPDHDTEVELSVDETPYPTTPEEHLVIVLELRRLDVELVSLAPRFCGDFEKGIDFKGDLDEFRNEYLLHQAIAEKFGGYKLSIHSGSDKFKVYEAIGELGIGNVHVKTAGTSYLEALRAVSLCDFSLFREILAFSMERFESDRLTYHISADPSKLRQPDDYIDEALTNLLDDDNARQILHVTFGSVLTQKASNGKSGYRDRMMDLLSECEEVYDNCIYEHFRKHIRPFEKAYKETNV